MSLDFRYSFPLDRANWGHLYAPEVEVIHEVCFGAEVSRDVGEPVLDPGFIFIAVMHLSASRQRAFSRRDQWRARDGILERRLSPDTSLGMAFGVSRGLWYDHWGDGSRC